MIGYFIIADLGTGVYHWAIDNYGSPSTPQIQGFQGHHKYPYTITRRAFAHAFVGVCAGCIMLSQQFHAWAHEKKGRLPSAVAALQEAGVLVSQAEHAAHHRPPYNSNYCIVSGAWNSALDEWRVFEAMEMVVFCRGPGASRHQNG